MTSVAIVHDYVVAAGGSERVLLSMHRAFPEAPVYTAFFRPENTYPEFASVDIRPFAINRVHWLRHHHQSALPLLPTVFARAQIDADVVVCGTSGWSAGVSTRGRKVLYMHAPARWLNDQSAFLAGRSRVERLGLRLVERRLRRWDRRAVESGSAHLVGSASMADDVRRLYGIDPVILPPPVTLDPEGMEEAPPEADVDPGFVLFAGRLVANKNVDVLLDVFRSRPDDRLVVAGAGADFNRLRTLAPTNVHFAGAVNDGGMRWLLRRCRAIVSASHESFGLVASEAARFGRPAIVLRHGGSIDTVTDGVTGVFFDAVDAGAISAAIDRATTIDPSAVRAVAQTVDRTEATFIRHLRSIVLGPAGDGGAASDGYRASP